MLMTKIIGVVLGIIMCVVSITACGWLEDRTCTEEPVMVEDSIGYTYTSVNIPHGKYEYETKFTFVGINGEKLDTYELNQVSEHFLLKGYTVSCIMYNEDFTMATMSVYSDTHYPVWYE